METKYEFKDLLRYACTIGAIVLSVVLVYYSPSVKNGKYEIKYSPEVIDKREFTNPIIAKFIYTHLLMDDSYDISGEPQRAMPKSIKFIINVLLVVFPIGVHIGCRRLFYKGTTEKIDGETHTFVKIPRISQMALRYVGTTIILLYLGVFILASIQAGKIGFIDVRF